MAKIGSRIYIVTGLDGIMQPFTKLSAAVDYCKGFIEIIPSLYKIKKGLREDAATVLDEDADWRIHRTKIL